jgi:hypothetical protein
MRHKPRLLGVVAMLVPLLSVLGCSKGKEAPPTPTPTLPATTTTTLKAILDGEESGYQECLDAATAKYQRTESKKTDESKPVSREEAKRQYDEASANLERAEKRAEAETKCHDEFVARVRPKMTEAGATPEQAEAALKAWVQEFLSKG